MATFEITHGATGTYIEVTCTDADGSTPDFSTGTFQIEVFRINRLTSVILDSAPTAVAPAATSGKLRYTFVSADWDTIPNRTENYSIKWWHTVGSTVTAYPGSGYDTLEVTGDPNGVPADVSSVSYLSTAVAAATYETIADAAATYLSRTTAALTYYVDAAGDDANPGTALLPFATIQYALDRIPLLVQHAVVINVGAGTFTEQVDVTKIVDASAAASVTIQGTLATVTPATGLASGTIASYSTRTATVTAAGWTTNDLRDKFLRTTADGELYPIASNTATTVELAYATGSLAGKAFDIVEPSTIVNGGTSAGDVAFWVNQTGVGKEIFSPLTEENVGLILRNMEIVARQCVRSAKRAKLYGCRLKYNQYGLLLEQGQAAQVFRSVILEQSAIGGAGVNSAWSQFLDVAGCYFRGMTGGAGVRAEGTNYFDVSSSGNVVEGHTYGYLLYDVLGSAEHYSILRGNTYGMYLGGKNTIALVSTTITGNTYGIYQSDGGTGSLAIIATNATISSNTSHGIHLDSYASLKMLGATALQSNGGSAVDVAGSHCSVEAYDTTNISSNVVFAVKCGFLSAFTNIYVASTCTIGSPANGADFTLDNHSTTFTRAACTAAAGNAKIESGKYFNRAFCP